MKRRRVAILAIALGALLLAGMAGALRHQRAAHVGAAEPVAGEHEKQNQRELNLRYYSDSSGRVRSDLYRKATQEFVGLKIDASRPVVSGPKKYGYGTTTATTTAGGGGVTGVQWTEIGPAPLEIDAEQNYQGAGPDAGQVVDIAIDPRNTTDKVIYAAFNDGGLWKSTDGGTTWAPKTDYMPSLSTGAVALDPANPSIVYVGTGNIFNNGFFKGVGVYRSIDAGDTFSLTAGSSALNGKGINRIVMPSANTLLVATNQGLYRSTDSGDTFSQVTVGGTTGQYITDIDLDTQSPSTVYAAVNQSGIYKSTDSGQTFPPANEIWGGGVGTSPSTNYSFISFAQSTTASGQTMYVDAQETDGNGGTGGTPKPNFLGMWKSTNGGTSWSNITAAANPSNRLDACQCGYDQTIGVDPVDENKVYIGFQELWYSSDGGGSFSKVGFNAIHWDHHALTFSPPNHRTSGDTSTRVWVGEDGGLAYSDDAGGSWTNANGGIATNLFRAFDIGRGNSTNEGYMYGGAQDTGTMRHKPADSGTQWHEAVDADGGPTAVDWQNPSNAFGISNGAFIRTTNAGDSWIRPGSGDISCVPMSAGAAVDPNNGNNVYVPDTTGTLNSDGSDCTQNGANAGIFRSTDGGASFPGAKFVQTPAQVTYIATTPTDSNVVWIGETSNGKVAVSTNFQAASPTFSEKTVTGAPSQAPIGIAIDPSNTDRVVVVFPGFSSTAAGALSKHVFLTTDGGTTWSDIGGTALDASQMVPDMPLYSVVIDPQTSPHAIIVSTDLGILRTLDNGATWQVLGVGLPNVNAASLQIDSSVTPSLLRVGTYGRSAFELTSATGPLLAVNCDLAFGMVDVGSNATKQCSLFNVGSSDLHVNGFFRSAGSSEFTIVSGPSTPVTIAPGSHVDYTIQFAPTSAGDKTATFQVNSDDPFQPAMQIPASGTGVGGKIALSGSLDFGVVPRGHTATKDVIVQNVGAGTLRLSSVTITGDAMFSIVSGPSTPVNIPSGEQVTYTVQFAPPGNAGPGTHTATFSVTSNDPSSPTTMGATGTVGVPTFTLSTTHLAYGGIAVDDRTNPSSSTLSTVVSNQSSCSLCDLTITGLAITGTNPGDFSLVSPPSLPYTVAAGNSLELKVKFDPTLGGARAATLTITTDDPTTATRTVDLDGTGLKPAIDADPATLIFGPTVYDPPCGTLCGSTLSEKFTNSGAAELIVDDVSFSGPPFSGLGPTTPPTRVQPGSSLTEQVIFHPTSAATKVTGNLHLADLYVGQDSLNIVSKDVPLCGEAVGRGIRVLAVNPSGVPYNTVTALTLKANGVSSPPNINLKNLPLVTIDPPTSCQTIKRQYENQNLSATNQSAPKSSYYTLTVTVGNKKSTMTFGLKVNEFKLIVINVG
jgi:hypothetical protein